MNILYDLGIKKPKDSSSFSGPDSLRLRAADLKKSERIFIPAEFIVVDQKLLSFCMAKLFDIYLKTLEQADADVKCLNLEDILRDSRITFLKARSGFLFMHILFRQDPLKILSSFLIPPQCWHIQPHLN